jgi:hypothetical protein
VVTWPCPIVEYAALLGFYLGDGCVSRAPRHFALRVSCDATYPQVIDDVAALMRIVHPTRPVFRVTAPGCVVVQSNWQHWPCLFPQHGPGRKHERPIVLEDWQRAIVQQCPADFLRGLFHSDGVAPVQLEDDQRLDASRSGEARSADRGQELMMRR